MAKLDNPHCDTCVYFTGDVCPIYKTAREMQIQHIPPSAFGCLWHITHSEMEKREKGRQEDEAKPLFAPGGVEEEP